MENFAVCVIPAMLSILLLRSLLIPMGFLLRLLLHSGSGFLCLWLLNSIAPFTGILFPINAATVLISGFLGLPGVALMAVLEIM